MRVLFMGTGDFAVPSLRALASGGLELIGVVTQPDRPAGRGRKTRTSPVKSAALELRLSIYQPENVKDAAFVEIVSDAGPDAVVVAAFGQLIPRSILSIPRLGCINVHGSLLPRYRGAAPVHYALFNGDRVTGVTTMLMDAGLDTGPILLQRELEILPEDVQGSLEARLAETGAALLMETLDLVQAGRLSPTCQDGSSATHAPSVKREECAVNWEEHASTVVNRIRGCTPRPGAWSVLGGVQLKIWKAGVLADAGHPTQPGRVSSLSQAGIAVEARKGFVLLEEVQPSGKARMAASEFARGSRLKTGDVFSSLDLSGER